MTRLDDAGVVAGSEEELREDAERVDGFLMRPGKTKFDFFRLEIVNRHVLGGGSGDQFGPISRRDKLKRKNLRNKLGNDAT